MRSISALTCLNKTLFSLLTEINPLDNTLGGLKLFYTSAAAGGLFGLIVSVYYYFSHRSDYDRPSLLVFSVMLAIIVTLFTVTIASRLNRSFTTSIEHDATFTVLSKGHSAGHKGPPQWYLGLNISNQTERIQVSEPFWNTISLGEKVKLTLRNGYFGFPIIVYYDHVF